MALLKIEFKNIFLPLVKRLVIGFVLTLLLSFLIFEYAGHFPNEKVSNVSQVKQKAIEVALLNFLDEKGYLPCPDTSIEGKKGFGFENRVKGRCNSLIGRIPFKTIGLPPMAAKDSQEEFISYISNKDFKASLYFY